jgi:hypothetical protein
MKFHTINPAFLLKSLLHKSVLIDDEAVVNALADNARVVPRGDPETRWRRSTETSSAVAVTVMPMGVAALWETSIPPPTLPSPSSSAGFHERGGRVFP